MLEEILSQPDGVRRTIEANRTAARQVAQAVEKRGGVDFALLVARGTSDNAATYAKYILALVNGLPAGLAAPSLTNLYQAPMRLDRVLVIAVSQSGETDEVVQALEYARSQGAFGLAITNESSSTLASKADATLVCRTGRERSVPATKTYTGELALMCLLSFTLAGRDDLLGALDALPAALEQTLQTVGPVVEERAERYRYMEQCLVLGRGLNYATALEAALKLKETCSLAAEALSAADFLHGPIAALAPGLPVILFAPADATLPSVAAIVKRLVAAKAEVVAVSDSPDVLSQATLALEVAPADDPIFWPFCGIVPIQLLAYHLALVKGLDPDRPRGLSKVTQSGKAMK